MKPIDALPSPWHYPKRCPSCLVTLALLWLGYAEFAESPEGGADERQDAAC